MILTDKTNKMENQEKQFNILEYFNDKVTDLELYNSEYKMIEEAFEEAKKMYAEEIIKAFNDGCLKGYNDHVKVTNDLNRYA